MLDDAAPTGAILTDVLGSGKRRATATLIRYAADAAVGGTVDIRAATGFLPGRMGGGSVHHVAFRAADDATQAAMVKRWPRTTASHTTEQKDRNYFRSVYFREPGGILFEIATDDRASRRTSRSSSLGRALKLPAFLEPRRAQIEAVLPDLS